MPQVVEIPGLGPIEFPDSMDDAAIAQAAKGLYDKHRAAAPPLDFGSKTPEQAAELAAQARPGDRPVTVGAAGMPQAVDAEMAARGMGYNARADALIGKGMADVGHGIKQLTVGLSPKDEADVQAWRDLSAGASMGEGQGMINAGTVGDIAGNAAMVAAPAAAIEGQVVKGMSRLPGALRALSLPAAGGIVGGAEGAVMPTLGDESRAANAAVGSGAGVVGGAVFPAARKVLTGLVKPSEDAAQLLAQGVVPTVGQGAESSTLQFAEELMKPVAVLGRRRARREVLEASVKRALPPGTDMPKLGSPAKLIKDLGDEFSRQYEEALEDVLVDTIEGVHKPVTGVLENPQYNIDPRARAQLHRWVQARMPDSVNADDMSAADFHEFRSHIRAEARRLGKATTADAQAAAEMLRDISTSMTTKSWDSFSDLSSAADLNNLDTAYRNFMVLQDAAASTSGRQKGLTPQTIAAAAQKAARPGATRAKELGPLQDIANPAARIMQAPGGPLTGMDAVRAGVVAGGVLQPAAFAGAALPAALGATRTGARAAFGDFPAQKALRAATKGKRVSALAGAVAADVMLTDKVE